VCLLVDEAGGENDHTWGPHTEPMSLLSTVFDSIFLCHYCRALQAEIIGGKCIGGASVSILGCLQRSCRAVENFAKHKPIMAEALVEVILAGCQEASEMF